MLSRWSGKVQQLQQEADGEFIRRLSEQTGDKSLEGRQFCNQTDDTDEEEGVDSKTLVPRRIDGEGKMSVQKTVETKQKKRKGTGRTPVSSELK